MVRHHLDPIRALDEWTRDMANLPDADWLETVDFVVQADSREMARQRQTIDIINISLSDAQVADIVAFLNALTGTTADTRPLVRPDTVPSGLSVD